MTRVVLVTGKGGVGKTTVAGATAMAAAEGGASVLVTSTDPAHSLGDLFEQELGDEVRSVAPGVDALQLDGQRRLEAHWADVRDWLVEVLVAGGANRLQAGELVLLPGMDELFSLLDVQAHVDAGSHDLVVVDCAPTAETLRLLALPEALAFYTERLLGPSRHLARLVRPVSSTVAGVPVPGEQVFSTVDHVQARLGRVQFLLTDPARTSVRLVLTPERMVIAESMRTATALSLFGHRIDAVVVNRVLDEVTDPASPLAAWHERQREELHAVDHAFGPWRRLHAPWQSVPPLGPQALADFGRSLYGGVDPGGHLSHVAGITVDTEGGGEVVLRVPLPFVARDEVDLHRRGCELHVRVGAVKRVVALPVSLADHEVVSAGMRDGVLQVLLRGTSAEVAS